MHRFPELVRDSGNATPVAETNARSLYEILFGEAWSSVWPAIQRAHPRELPIERIGSFDITHGRCFIARLLARLSKLPPDGRAVPTRLRVERMGSREFWRRNFGSFPLESTQHVPRDGILVERFGRIEFRFSAQARDGGIHFRQTRVAIVIGPCRMPLPAWLGPRVDAQEMPGNSEDQTRVRVTVRLALVGLLIDYQGRIEQLEMGEGDVIQ